MPGTCAVTIANAPTVESIARIIHEAAATQTRHLILVTGVPGAGKTLVRGVKDYVKRYSTRPGLVPPQHVLVFDEAQRAFDPDRVRELHGDLPGFKPGQSEPAHSVEFAGRIPQW